MNITHLFNFLSSIFKNFMADAKNNTGTNNTGNSNTGNYNTGYRNTGYRNTGNYNTGYYNTGDCNTGYYNTGTFNTGNRNTGNYNTGYLNTGNCNTGTFNTGNRNTGNYNTGYYNTGDCNTGNYNTGMFNTNEPEARFFNKPTNLKMSEFIMSDAYPDFSGIDPCVWVLSDIMTAEEKKKYPTHETTGGYLKTIEYKEAWAIFWRKTSEKNKKKILALPNFDAAIFKEITGIDVTIDNGNAQKKAEILAKIEELKKQAENL